MRPSSTTLPSGRRFWPISRPASHTRPELELDEELLLEERDEDEDELRLLELEELLEADDRLELDELLGGRLLLEEEADEPLLLDEEELEAHGPTAYSPLKRKPPWA